MKLPFTLILTLLLYPVIGWAQVQPVPELTGRVVDLADVLDSGTEAAITSQLEAVEQGKGVQIAVLTIQTTNPEAIEPYALRVFEAWKLGRKNIDDGGLLVIAVKDRKVRIEVGYGLEGALSDIISKRIIESLITPEFRNGNFPAGIRAGVDGIIKVVNGEQLPEVAPAPNPDGTGVWILLVFFVILIVFFPNTAAMILSSGSISVGGSRGGGGGFSGGGGSGGGGGASGSW